jgi:hypothetical protein
MFSGPHVACTRTWNYASAAALAVSDAILHATTDAPSCVVNNLQVRLSFLFNHWITNRSISLFSTPYKGLLVTSAWWGKCLRWSSPLFVGMEGLASLLVIQFTGRKGKEIAEQGESLQFGLLVGAAAAYVASAWWLVVVSLLQCASFSSSDRVLLVDVPGYCSDSAILDSGRRCGHQSRVLDIDRVCSTANQCHRVCWYSALRRLQHLAVFGNRGQ